MPENHLIYFKYQFRPNLIQSNEIKEKLIPFDFGKLQIGAKENCSNFHKSIIKMGKIPNSIESNTIDKSNEAKYFTSIINGKHCRVLHGQLS